MNVCSVCRRCYEESVAACDIEDHGALAKARSGDCLIVKGYKIDSQIKSDSPAELYKAAHIASGKTVLIKFIDLSASVCSREELENEIRAVIQTNHPNLARVFEHGNVGENEIYVVLEDVSGLTLRDYLEKISPLPERNAIKIVRQIAEALEALHKNGQVHRAVNPSNIYFADQEKNDFSVKLNNYDFGGTSQRLVAAGANGVDARTEIFRYFSPEQFADESVDFRSDLYSLAVVFYEMLLGHSPYDSFNPQAIADYVFNESDVEKLHFDLRALLAYTLKQSLQHRLNLRPPTTNNLARQLRHLELVATPPSIGIADTSKNQTKQKTNVSQIRKPQPSIKPKPLAKPLAAETKIPEPEIALPEILTAEKPDEPMMMPRFDEPVIENLSSETVAGEIPEVAEITAVSKDYVIPEVATTSDISNASEDFVAPDISFARDNSVASEISIASENSVAPEVDFVPEVLAASDISIAPPFEETLEEPAIVNSEIVGAQIYDAAVETKNSFDSEPIDDFDSAGDEDTSEQIHITNKDFDDEFLENYSLESDNEESEIEERSPERESVTDRYIANSFGAYAQPQTSYFNKTSAYAAGLIALIVFGGFVAARVWTSQDDEKNSGKTAAPPAAPAVVVKKVEQPVAAPAKSIEPSETIEETAALPQYDGPAETEISKTDEPAITPRFNKTTLAASAPKPEKRSVAVAADKEKVSKPSPEKEIVKTPVAKKQVAAKPQNDRTDKPAAKAVAEKNKPAAKRGDGMTRPRIVTNIRSGN